jgi:Fe-S-cluster containining protein
MVKEVLVNKETRWQCISCGKCCHKMGDEFSLKLFNKKIKEGKCPNLNEKNMCEIYSQRPLGCKMYPFYPDKRVKQFFNGKRFIQKNYYRTI